MKSLWELLWDYDPNGLVVVDARMVIQVVNPAFCRMFQTSPEALIGTHAGALLGDLDCFQQVRETKQAVAGLEREYPQYGLNVRKVLFPVLEEDMVACIMVDLTDEWKQRSEIQNLRRETILKVHSVVDKQMKVAQKIAGLLGETTAETKASLLKLLELVEKEQG
ncbi:MAG: PAS domain-containing protein [Chloroflexota bacterium]|jgi:PAS domain-containing protein